MKNRKRVKKIQKALKGRYILTGGIAPRTQTKEQQLHRPLERKNKKIINEQ